MLGLTPVVLLLSAFVFVIQFAVCWILFCKGHFRKLPWFTAYIALNLCQAGFLYFVYSRARLDIYTRFWAAWISQPVTLLVRAFAIAEACRHALRVYPGVWNLARRASWIISVGVILFLGIEVSLDSFSFWTFVYIDRGFHLASLLCLIAFMLLNMDYYISIHRFYVALIGGFCFYSVTMVLADTLLKTALSPRSSSHEAIWQMITIVPYLAVEIIWLLVLRGPLPPNANPAPLVIRPATPRRHPIRYGLRRLAAAFARLVLPQPAEPS